MARSEQGILPRSFLYVPGDRPELFPKAEACEADAVILDLEDAVAPDAKAAARRHIGRWLEEDREPDRWWVRVDAATLEKDIAAIAGTPGLSGVILAKAEFAGVSVLLEHAPSVPVIGLVESARGLRDAPRMARVQSLVGFGVGRVDLLADLRVDADATGPSALASLYLDIVVTCAASGLPAPIAPTSTDFRDLDGFTRTTREFVALGFRSRTCLHPRQCAVVNRVLTPGDEELAAARDMIARYESGGATVVDARGRFVDAAVVRAAYEVVTRANASKTKESRHASP